MGVKSSIVESESDVISALIETGEERTVPSLMEINNDITSQSVSRLVKLFGAVVQFSFSFSLKLHRVSFRFQSLSSSCHELLACHSDEEVNYNLFRAFHQKSEERKILFI